MKSAAATVPRSGTGRRGEEEDPRARRPAQPGTGAKAFRGERSPRELGQVPKGTGDLKRREPQPRRLGLIFSGGSLDDGRIWSAFISIWPRFIGCSRRSEDEEEKRKGSVGLLDPALGAAGTRGDPCRYGGTAGRASGATPSHRPACPEPHRDPLCARCGGFGGGSDRLCRLSP